MGLVAYPVRRDVVPAISDCAQHDENRPHELGFRYFVIERNPLIDKELHLKLGSQASLRASCRRGSLLGGGSWDSAEVAPAWGLMHAIHRDTVAIP